MSNQTLMAGTAKIDITPKGNVWMDGMIRSHESEGIHDPLFVRALVISPEGADKNKKVAIVSCDVCVIPGEVADKIRKTVSGKTGIPVENMVVAATHTHSGPSTYGFFNPPAKEYTDHEFIPKVIDAICQANDSLAPAAVGYTRGEETTISYYRRLWTDEGKILMNWEPYPPEKIVGPAEEADNEVGVVKIVSADDPASVIAIVYDHAGHPNVMSGENFQISADYPGLASKIVEDKFGGIAIFLNGAHGSLDIDGLKDRDWEGVDRTGNALGNVVAELAGKIKPKKAVKVAVTSRTFTVPARTMTPEEISWSKDVMKNSTGEVVTLADGVGDDYKANLFLELDKKTGTSIDIEMVGVALGDLAFVSFPGELFNEIGAKIKKQSPFKYTYTVDCANSYVGYYPTKKAIAEGGYAVETRRCDDTAEEIIIKNSLDILNELAKAG
ncbi:MAG: neutral/alkaline non-lysosomal ceramidase N-terminal domain-containing protein [Sedimentisphaerales bacterium]|nr:neutral/alkaline non-lysosomal ceramidase N-terminal domain-containing protein [Sedimentisphaerales bacterium]